MSLRDKITAGMGKVDGGKDLVAAKRETSKPQTTELFCSKVDKNKVENMRLIASMAENKKRGCRIY